MTTNRQLFVRDPATFTIPNEGVTKLSAPQSQAQWDVLRYELSNFVCDGEYQRGLERILGAYLGHLSQPEQPAVWVSGFYGSGKSHLVRVLEYLWRDVEFPDGARARGLVHLPADVAAHLTELTNAGRQAGGLWAAAGTLGAAAGGSVRLALLALVFRNAGLPEAYPLARFVLWLKHEGYYDAVRAAIEHSGRVFERELTNLYVSRLAEALLEVYPDFAADPASARAALRAQYPPVPDISVDDFLASLADVLEIQSARAGRLPLTLLVLDELQQFLGEDSDKIDALQNVVEACCTRFGSRLLFVATGQAALQATPQLSKLKDRFTVSVMLSDSDVDQVVRKVVLAKRPDRVAELQTVLANAQGEIDRHLVGARIAPRPADRQDLVPDYPLLPVRRRFWEAALRSIDVAGSASQLRTQLRMVHEAARELADQPLGTVVPADVMFTQQQPSMLQSGILLRDLAAVIDQLRDGTSEGELRSRLCALIFLIGKLPAEGPAAPGVRATADALADLLVADLTAGSASLRQHVPASLLALVESGTLMRVDDEYRLQTRESAEWQQDFTRRFARLRADDMRIAGDRTDALRQAVAAALKGISLVQGAGKVPRKLETHFGPEPPAVDTLGAAVPVWVRDEWSVAEKAVRQAAHAAGDDSPLVHVLLPRRDSDALRDALAACAAARECLDAHSASTTPEGTEARTAMQSRHTLACQKATAIIETIVQHGRVFLGGGAELAEDTFAASVRAAAEAALVRLFPEFQVADHPAWGTVVRRAQDGAADALAALGYSGDADKHPVCLAVRAHLGTAGHKGRDIRKHFTGGGHGWPQDAVDGALLALVAGGFVRASQNTLPVAVRGLTQTQIGVTDFFNEGVTVSALQRIAVRKLLADLGLPIQPDEEAAALPRLVQHLTDLAAAAGGPPPLPPLPLPDVVDRLAALAGNEQFVAVFEAREELQAHARAWTAAAEKTSQRLPRWNALQRLLGHAAALPAAGDVAPQAQAIQAERTLLADPDPLPALVTPVVDALRAAVQAAAARYDEMYRIEFARLESSPEWLGVAEADERAHLLAQAGLAKPEAPHLGTETELLAALDARPLSAWDDLIAALPGRFAAARLAAARLQAPQAVRVIPPPATLTDAAAVDAYLAELRAAILRHIDAGRPVIL